MKIAIYSRKSRASEQGESIQNQIDMCKAYADTHFKDIEFFVYKDDGFSGGNIDRPEFQLLLKELKKRSYDVLMCYRLDRISRNVSDFSSTLDMLTKNDIGFVSIKENFDTTTPMGRAMIHISSVFAQLERETTTERITDNMFALARTGRWLGGTAPTGFDGKREMYVDGNGDKKFAVKLTPVPEEQKIIETIFDKYIELGSISKVVTYCVQNDIRSKNNKILHAATIGRLLNSPVYCVADGIAYDYFAKHKSIIELEREDFDGKFGIMPYGRTNQAGDRVKNNDMSKWIIAIGKHKGVITSDKWIKVQKMLKKNSHKAIRGESPTNALLSPLLRCGSCGARMIVTGQTILADGTPAYYYKCQTKDVSKGTKCDIANIAGYKLDEYVVEHIKRILSSQTGLDELLESEKKDVLEDKKLLTKNKSKIENTIKKNRDAIDGLIMKLVELGDEPGINDYVKTKVSILHNENEKLKIKLKDIEDEEKVKEVSELNIDMITDSLLNFNALIDSQDVLGKRKLIQDVVRKIEWDGKEVHIGISINKLDHG
ncbi:MAG TPA: recombinase family protein [Epulopiscium sp.]|nr:recombinase family protein [Candidatus Epulonipiscium sp.]